MRELREWLLGRLRLSRDEREGGGLRGSKEDAVEGVCTYVCVTEGCVCVCEGRPVARVPHQEAVGIPGEERGSSAVGGGVEGLVRAL